jgi:hypothetical protein
MSPNGGQLPRIAGSSPNGGARVMGGCKRAIDATATMPNLRQIEPAPCEASALNFTQQDDAAVLSCI